MNELARTDTFMPALTLQQAIERRNAIVDFTTKIMRPGVDYGKVPGTDKDVLLKPGAEKLCTQFGLAPVFERLDVVKDWTGQTTGGEPLFYFEYRCRLYRSGTAVGEGIGSCNSWEKKYRYRKAERLCPSCGAQAIKRSKYPPRNQPSAQPGWYCYEKVGGCGANYAADEPAITQQETGYTPNPDIFDTINTIDKMAQKRALIAATLIALNASEFFTQDLDDQYIVEAEYVVQEQPKASSEQKRTPERAAVIERIKQRWDEEKQLGGRAPASELAIDFETANIGDLIALGQQIRARIDRLSTQKETEKAKEPPLQRYRATPEQEADMKALEAQQTEDIPY